MKIKPKADNLKRVTRRDTAKKKHALHTAHERAPIGQRKKDYTGAEFDSLPGLYYLINEQGRFLHWNRIFETVSGYSSEEISRMSPTDFFTDQEKDVIAEKIRQVFATGKASVEADFVAKDQTRTPYFFTGKRVQIDKKPCLSGMGIDITEHKRTESALRESELTYSTLFENMLNGFAYCRMLYENGQPQDFIYISVNRSFEILTGLKNVVGRRVTEVIPGIRETDSRLFELYGRVAMNGQPERFEMFINALQQWFLISVYCPKREHFVAVFDVITERMQTAAMLSESEKKLHAIVDGALDGIAVVDLETRKFLTGNLAISRMLGYTPEEFHRLGVSDIHPKQDMPYILQQLGRQVHGDVEIVADIPVMRKDGSVFFVDINSSRIYLGGKEALLGIFRDVTERKQAETRIAHLANIREALSSVNRAIVHAVNEKSLFEEICRIAVQRAGLTLALICMVDAESGELRPVASLSETKELITRMMALFSEIPLKSRPIGIAILEERTLVYQDVQEVKGTFWSEFIYGIGLRSAAVIPIRKGGKVAGAIAVSSSRKGYFDAETLILLEEMAQDVSFSLDMLQRGVELVDSEQRFRAVLEQSIVGIFVIQDGQLAYLNARMYEILGYRPDEAVDPDPLSFVTLSNRDMAAELMTQCLNGQKLEAFSITALRKDGSEFTLGFNAILASYDGRPAIITVAQDITEKARAEDEIKRYVARLQRALDSTINIVSTIGEIRDPYTHGHEHRVGEIAAEIGAELGFNTDRVQGLRITGYMHDVGKISVPAEILSKPAQLTDTEFALVKTHAQMGYEILNTVDFPWPVAEVARQHHERIDGSGYPRGLKGDEIILEARITAVADVIEAMSSHRPYRPGLGIEAALVEIEEGRGRIYDAQVADACLRLFREKGYKLPV